MQIQINPKDIIFTDRNDEDCAFWNARQNFLNDKMLELKENIRKTGLISSPILRKYGEGVQLIAGERRLRSILSLIENDAECFNLDTQKMEPASKVYKKITCNFVKDCDDKLASQISVAENLKRNDLSEIDIMQYCMDLITRKKNDGTSLYTRKEISDMLDMSEGWVSQTVSLFDLPDRAKELLGNGVINRTHAVYLLKVAPDKVNSVLDDAERLAQEAYDDELSRAERNEKALNSKLTKQKIAVEAIEILNGAEAAKKPRKAKESLEKAVEAATKHTRHIRTRGRKITQDLLQEAAETEPGKLVGKSTSLSHKVLRKMHAKLSEELNDGVICCPESGLEYDSEHVEICIKMLEMVLGMTMNKTPLGVLREFYIENGVDGWIDLADEESDAGFDPTEEVA